MAVQALYRKWRPRAFDEVVGQKHVVRTLRNALVSGRIRHAYLFAGPRGTGKTTMARLLAKAVNCLAPEAQRPCNECEICQAINEGRLLDLIEIDAASNTGVDDVRELRERVGFQPNEARYKVYVIDEVHMLSNAAFNALLKTLEEPPAHAIFVLATTEPHKILPTVLSRCQRFDFHRIPTDEIADRLAWIAEQEGIRAERHALMLIAREATGSMRDAESLLDQLASYESEGIAAAQVRAVLGIGTDETVIRITDALAEGDAAKGLGVINAVVDEGADPRHFARQIVEHLRVLLLLDLESGVVPSHVLDDLRPRLEQQAAAFSRRALAKAIRLFNEAAAESRGGWQPQLPLEMAFVEAMLSVEPSTRDPGGSSSAVREAQSSRDSAPSKPRYETPSGQQKGAHSAESSTSSRSASASPPDQSQAQAVRETGSSYGSDETEDETLAPATVRERWSEVLNALRPHDLSLEALMRSCEPVAVQGDVVVLGFAYEFHRSKVEEDEKRRIIEGVLSDLFGRKLRVRCVMSSQEQGAADSRALRKETEEEGDSTNERLIAGDPVVRAAVEDLGAQIVSG